ncbi:MAG: tRNA (5-methylaminomethyl-2-thiouridine)(34)-methyltransferase MnmD, partial [Pseudomonadota bacterium]
MTGKADNARGVAAAKLDWSADGQTPDAPRSFLFDDIYFSGDGLAEANHVFIEGNALLARFRGARRFSIGELGFGTGLNLVAAWRAWDDSEKPDCATLDFFSIEKYPLLTDDLARAHQAWPSLSDRTAALRAALPPPAPGLHRRALAPDVYLTLYYGDVADGLDAFDGACDAWFLDGFSPAKNPEMWDDAVMARVADRSQTGATVATFTVAGAVRRALAEAGFEVEKRPGFGRKREMLVGALTRPPARPVAARPWFAPPQDEAVAPGARIAVIGGGVAGASLAHALSARGFILRRREPGTGRDRSRRRA